MVPNPIGDRIERLAQAIAERVVNLVVEAVDVDRLLDRIDIERIAERVDVEALVSRIDLNALVEQVDINALVERVDIDALVAHSELGSLIARSTTGVMTEALDLIRAQGVGLDDFLARWANRLLHRQADQLPQGPPLLVGSASRSVS